jgi:hypothetical protein
MTCGLEKPRLSANKYRGEAAAAAQSLIPSGFAVDPTQLFAA